MLTRSLITLTSGPLRVSQTSSVRRFATERGKWSTLLWGKDKAEETTTDKEGTKTDSTTQKITPVTQDIEHKPKGRTFPRAPKVASEIKTQPVATYTPYNVGNTTYPMFEEAEKYPGVAPAPLRNSKIDFPVIDFHTKQQTKTIPISREVFNAPLRTDILHRLVVYELDGKRQGTSSTKTRGEVRGGGKKPWQQKGTGRARIGSIRAPHWRGGGVTFGPKPRDHSSDLPLKLRALGLSVALSTKLAQGKLVVVDGFNLESHKTKHFAKHIPEEWGKVLVVEGSPSKNFTLATANLPKLNSLNHVELNVHDILRHDTLVLTTEEIKGIEERIRYETLGKRGREILQTKEAVKISIQKNAELKAARAAQKAAAGDKKIEATA